MTKKQLHKYYLLVLIFSWALLCPLLLSAQSDPVEEVVVDSTVFKFNDQPQEGTQTTTNEVRDEEVEYSSPNFADTATLRNVPQKTIDSLKAKKDFEYANDPSYWIKEKPKESTRRSGGFFNWLFESDAVRWIMYIVLVAVIMFVIYRIIVNNNLFYNSSRKIPGAGEDEIVEAEYDNLDYKIQAAIDKQEYRKAVRYLYVKTLRQLDDRGWIRFHSQGTNHEYISQMSKYPLSGDFNFITRVYEYVWYGEFDLNEHQFGQVRTNFDKILKAVA